jgi:hypothetical protein
LDDALVAPGDRGDALAAGGFMSLFRRSNDIEVSISPESIASTSPGRSPSMPPQAAMPFPAEPHPKHLPARGPVRWRLAVAASTNRIRCRR